MVSTFPESNSKPCSCGGAVKQCWVYMRDNRPFGGQDSSAAMCYYSNDRPASTPRRICPTMRRDLSYEADCKLSAIVEAGCRLHARPPFFQMADVTANAHRRA
jgi:transposase